MHNFRQFEAGPDPFGRKFQVYFKWLQTAITLRHADTVDVKFILVDDNGGRSEKTIALPHPDLLHLSRETGRMFDDSWSARLAAAHLVYMIEAAEASAKDLVTVSLVDLHRYAAELAQEESAVRA